MTMQQASPQQQAWPALKTETQQSNDAEAGTEQLNAHLGQGMESAHIDQVRNTIPWVHSL